MFAPGTQRLVLNAEHSSWRVFRNTILLALAIGFPVFGYYFAQSFWEPYPWLIMPGFQGDKRDSEGNFAAYRTDVLVVFQDGSQESVSLMELFHPAPSFTTTRIYSRLIRPDPNNSETREEILGTPETSRFYYLKRYLQPGMVSRKFNERPAVPHPETLAWLSNRVVELFPGRAARELRFENTRTLFDASGGLMEKQPPVRQVDTVIQLSRP